MVIDNDREDPVREFAEKYNAEMTKELDALYAKGEMAEHEKLKKSVDARVKQMYAKTNLYVNVLIKESPDKEDVGKIKLWKVPLKHVWSPMEEWINQGSVFFDAEEGNDIVIKVSENVSEESGKKSKFLSYTPVCSMEKSKVEYDDDKLYPLLDFTDPNKLETPEKIKNRLEKFLGSSSSESSSGGSSGAVDIEDTIDDSKSTPSEETSKSTPTSTPEESKAEEEPPFDVDDTEKSPDSEEPQSKKEEPQVGSSDDVIKDPKIQAILDKNKK